MPETPAYLRIAGDLRTAILSGDLLPDSRLPSETKLMAQYGVSRTVVKWALSVLKGDGLVKEFLGIVETYVARKYARVEETAGAR